MGQVASLGLTQYDVEEVINYCDGVWNQREVDVLYRRFRTLDRGRKGYISGDEFLAIPELSINPVASRLVRMYESVNFKEFAKMLSAFSSKASKDSKLHYMFVVYDVDGDGIISRDDLHIMLRQLGGSSLGEEELTELVEVVLQQAKSPQGLDMVAFKTALADPKLTLENMVVQVPIVD
jgi:serine/threonine-protein phosphatase 2B regulatory subunit